METRILSIIVLCKFAQYTLVTAAAESLPITAFLRPDDVDNDVLTILRFSEQYLASGGVAAGGENELHDQSEDGVKLRLYTDEFTSPTNNSHLVWNTVCSRLSLDGSIAVLAGGTRGAHGAYDSLGAALHLPYVNWALAPAAVHQSLIKDTQLTQGVGLGEGLQGAQYVAEKWGGFSVSMEPPTDRLIADIIREKNWRNITFMIDGTDSVLLAQNVFSHLHDYAATLEFVELPDDEEDFDDFIFFFHQQRFDSKSYSIIADVRSASRLAKFTLALHQVSLKSPELFHYLIADFGVTSRDVERFERGFLNVTLLQILDRDTATFRRLSDAYLQFRRSRGLPGDADIPVDLAFVYEGMLTVQKAVEIMRRSDPNVFSATVQNGVVMNRGEPGLRCSLMETTNSQGLIEKKFSTFELGPKIIDTIKHLVTIDSSESLTGKISFNNRGIRKGFTVKVTDLTFGYNAAVSTKQSADWVDGIGFLKTTPAPSQTPIKRLNLTGKELTITTVLTMPHVMYKQDAETMVGNEKFEGYCVDLIKELARIIGFKYNIHLVTDGQYGSVNDDGSWNGMIGELLAKEAQLAVAPLTISRQRERVVDFSKPFMVTGITIMIKKPDKEEFSVFSFMQPLSTEIWVYITCALLGVSMVIFIVSRFSPYEWKVEETSSGFSISNDFSLYNCLWFTLAALVHQGTDILPRSVSGRIASSSWWFFTLIMMSSYTANLAAFLTSEKLQASIDSVDALAEQTEIKYGIQQGGSTAAFFKGKYAFLLEGTANEYANTRKPCDTMKVGDPLNSVGYGVATPIGSDLRSEINFAILELQETGALKKLENKWWYDRGQCEQGVVTSSQGSSLNLSKVAGIFYILMVGMALSMAAACAEVIYRAKFSNKAPADSNENGKCQAITFFIQYAKTRKRAETDGADVTEKRAREQAAADEKGSDGIELTYRSRPWPDASHGEHSVRTDTKPNANKQPTPDAAYNNLKRRGPKMTRKDQSGENAECRRPLNQRNSSDNFGDDFGSNAAYNTAV